MRQAEADQATAHAAVETAQINLGYTRIVAPIGGRTGTSAYTEGALVTANQDNALTTVQQYDPMYVDLAQAAATYCGCASSLPPASSGAATSGRPRAAAARGRDALCPRGAPRVHRRHRQREHRRDHTARRVSEPDGTLLPGLFVRAQLDQATDDSALLVPQQAVSRDARGGASALVVGAEDRVEWRTLNVEAASGNLWRVSSGLSSGDRVIVQGQQKAHVGAAVKPVVIDMQAAARDRDRPVARFFIDRPIFAWVIAIIIMAAGALAIRGLPVEQYRISRQRRCRSAPPIPAPRRALSRTRLPR